MRITSIFCISLLMHFFSPAQTISLSGVCISNTITLNKTITYNGKPAYEGTGTVQGSSVDVSIYWEIPENVWVLAFSGQPYFMSPCNRSTPPSTSNPGCSWSEVTPGSCTGATPLSITGTGTLPTRLTTFTATKGTNSVQLNWTTASEINNKGFEVQRSTNGSDWAKLTFVEGAGTAAVQNNYHFEDMSALNGLNFYRLVQYDFDGAFTYSPVVKIDFHSKGFYTLQQQGNGRYQVNIEATEPVELAVLDVSGRILFSKSAGKGLHAIDISSSSKGIYLLRLKGENKQPLTEKLFKN